MFKYLKIERPIENIQVYGDTAVVTGNVKMDVIVEGKPKLLSQPLHRCVDQRHEGLADGGMAVYVHSSTLILKHPVSTCPARPAGAP